MIHKISERIEDINKLLAWLKENKPEHYEQRFVPLVQERCRLRTILEAKRENPAVAAYGESQKGKSYLMGNLLQKNGKPFMISVPGKKINFVRSINPIGKMREATGVVTRFTAFQGKNSERYSEEYPVLMKLLTVSDMATILCDSYYNDLRDPGHYTDQEIKDKGDAIYEKYKACPPQQGTHLVEDDIIDIKNYVQQNMKRSANSLVNGANSSIFDKVALVIRNVPQREWSQVLGFLWHENEVFTQLFERLVGAMSRLGFPHEVYLPIEAVCHGGVNENTIMSVACLNGLDKPNFDKKTDVYIRMEGGKYNKVPDFNKAELCAICAETAYRVDEEYLSTKGRYSLDCLPEATKGKLKSEEVDKDVINVADLLDFPGARNRESIAEAKLSDFDEKEGASNTVKSLLRGKVAYLFNKYCASRAINILMFCHDQMNYNVTNMPFVIENWVNNYVGKTCEERSETVKGSDGISPLFVIATKFNMDMTLDQDNILSELNSEAAVNGRWNGRFQEVLYRDCLQAHSVEWFNNWIQEGVTFKNTYLLRDFKYSTCSGDGSGLYEGYVEDSDNPKEERMHIPQEFYNRLRSTFITSEIVGKFFDDPAKSWDLAATRNNDGALYIIERLRTVARNMDDIRDKQFNKEIQECTDTVRKMMENDYEPEDDTATREKDIRTARRILGELDTTCECDKYFFGHLIQTLQIDSTLAYNIVKDYIDNGDISEGPEDSPYEIVLRQCDDFRGLETPEEMMKRFMDVYGLETETEADAFLARKGIKKSVLFSKKKVKLSNSAVIANIVYQAWLKQLRSSELLNRLINHDDNDEVATFTILTNRIADVAEQIGLCDQMEKEIQKYVNIVKLAAAKADLVSDILSHLINSFVVDLGYSLRSEEDVEACRMLAEQYHIPLFKYIGKGIEELPEEDYISELFTKMISNGNKMTRTFEQNYFEWKECMFIAFLAGATHIIKNPEANRALGDILKRLKL